MNKLHVPVWFFVLDCLYRNRITLLNHKLKDDCNIKFIQNDLLERKIKVTYSHLVRNINFLCDHNFVKRKVEGRNTIISLTYGGENLVKGINFNLLYPLKKDV